MKFETTPAFDGDYRRLKPERQAAFRRVLRVKVVRGAPGILEMTWSFASPGGRATFELITVDDEIRCRWRRVGDHDVFKET